MNRIILCFYSILLFVLQPLVLIYLLKRSRKQPEYAQHWGERFAFYKRPLKSLASRRIWIHAVSLGETRAAAPLIEAVYQRCPDAHIILTHTTPTGRAAGQDLFANALAAGRMTQVYVPYDLHGALARFFRVFLPTDVWVMETEVWPNMVAACLKRNIPISLINGRLSTKSLKSTLKWPRLMGAAYQGFQTVFAQTDADAAHYRQLGVAPERITVTGNLKFDMKAPVEQLNDGAILKSLVADKTIVLLASTRDGEEAMWLNALKTATALSNVQWWVVPRHPQRFDEVEQLLHHADFTGQQLCRKSQLDGMTDQNRSMALHQAKVVLGDTMGQMFAYYACADIVLMGGAWQPLGGQNFLESLSLGKPTLIGTHTFNFAQAADDAVSAQALLRCDDMTTALQMVSKLINEPDFLGQQQRNAQAFGQHHMGAVRRTLDALLPL